VNRPYDLGRFDSASPIAPDVLSSFWREIVKLESLHQLMDIWLA
jgi:hypothetical protein